MINIRILEGICNSQGSYSVVLQDEEPFTRSLLLRVVPTKDAAERFAENFADMTGIKLAKD